MPDLLKSSRVYICFLVLSAMLSPCCLKVKCLSIVTPRNFVVSSAVIVSPCIVNRSGGGSGGFEYITKSLLLLQSYCADHTRLSSHC